jgi:two-component system chemotaxis response regulator CheB
MPRSALRHVDVDHCVEIAQMVPPIIGVLRAFNESQPQALERQAMDDALKYEVRMAAPNQVGDPAELLQFGAASLFTCPDCHGALVQLRETGPLRFRCHTGHAFTADSLVASLSESAEEALWSTFRALQEKVMLLRHMAKHARKSDETQANKLLREAHSIHARANLVRQALLSDQAPAPAQPADADVR